MFVLLVGLMGIGAMIPAGRYEIMQGVKTDYATTVGRAAFRDIKARGMMDPRTWRDSNNNAMFIPATQTFILSAPPPWVIDPLGLVAPPMIATFPCGPSSPSLTRFKPSLGMLAPITSPTLFDPIFRCSDDVMTTPDPTRRDAPPTQLSFRDALNNPIRRSSEGNYSWLATIVNDPTVPALSSKMTVSVAVVYKRNLADVTMSERRFTPVTFPTPGTWTGDVILPGVTAATAVRPGQWIMLAGNLTVPNPTPPPPIISVVTCRWYRVVSADALNGTTQQITLHGADWNMAAIPAQAWMIDGVIAVYEKNLRLEVE